MRQKLSCLYKQLTAQQSTWLFIQVFTACARRMLTRFFIGWSNSHHNQMTAKYQLTQWIRNLWSVFEGPVGKDVLCTVRVRPFWWIIQSFSAYTLKTGLMHILTVCISISSYTLIEINRKVEWKKTHSHTHVFCFYVKSPPTSYA